MVDPERLASAVGRNVLVHACADVDDHRVVAALEDVEDVGDLEALSAAVARWAIGPTSPGL